ncbi:MAG: hypothetical protein N2037_04510 [Acidimicrobiales bacterium]|nr:hypothetical protein [Acidimicrobiales bacterium]
MAPQRFGRSALLLSAALAVVWVACVPVERNQARTSEDTVPRKSAPVDYSAPGPYPVGVTELDIGPSRTTPSCATEGGSAPPNCEQSNRTAIVYYPASASSDANGTRELSGYVLHELVPPPLRSAIPPQLDEHVSYDAPVLVDAPANHEAPFPLVLHSHDTNSDPRINSNLLLQVASWGFVVAAPVHSDRTPLTRPAQATPDQLRPLTDSPSEDVRDTLTALRVANVTPDQPLAGAVNFEQIAVTGVGAGALTALKLLNDPVIDTAIVWSPATPAPLEALVSLDPSARATELRDPARVGTPPAKPTLLIVAERDTVTPAAGASVLYEWLAPPKRLATINGAGHSSFTDLCPAVRSRGGYRQYAFTWPALISALWSLDDGCIDGYLEPGLARQAVHHLIVAQLRWVFGLDDDDVSLSPTWLHQRLGALGEYATESTDLDSTTGPMETATASIVSPTPTHRLEDRSP